MNEIRYFEKSPYTMEILKEEDYPLVDQDCYNYMKSMTEETPEIVRCFPYCRYDSGRVFVDIYIWDPSKEEGYKRFVFAKGCILSEEKEDLFVAYCSGQLLIEEWQLFRLVDDVGREFPELHLMIYPDRRHVLQHLYFALHMSGVKEILFKVNLNYLAVELDKIEDFNMIGSTPQLIFDVQLGMLRALNSLEGVECLKTPQMREVAYEIYEKCHNFIKGRILNRYQWKYLCSLIENGKVFERQMFEFLGRIDKDEQYHTYLRYLELREVVKEYYTHLPLYPNVKELEDKAEICSMIEWCIEHENALDRILKAKADLYEQDYTYESETFRISVPASVSDFLSEANGQHNCFYQCIFDMAFDKKIELIMRDKRKPNEALVTIEVEDDFIEQAYQACNTPISEEQRAFLEEFAEAKNLFILE